MTEKERITLEKYAAFLHDNRAGCAVAGSVVTIGNALCFATLLHNKNER